MTRAAAIALPLLASACFAKPDAPAAPFDAGPLVDDSGHLLIDAPLSGGCTVRDDFNANAIGCGAWATPPTLMNAIAVHHDDAMSLRFVSLGGGTAQCRSKDAVDIISGARVQIVAVVPEAYSYTSFDVVETFSSQKVGVRIDGLGGNPPTVSMISPAGQSQKLVYDGLAMAWWQLRREELVLAAPNISSTEVVLEYSANGSAPWTELSRYPAGSVTFKSANVQLSATINGTTSNVAVFDNLDACP